jgi:3'-5' exonuclease
MIRTIQPRLFAFDIEWIPDPEAAHRLYGIDISTRQGMEDACRTLWEKAGATRENPHPFVKLTVSRIVSICGIYREVDSTGDINLKLVSLPADPLDPEQQKESAILRGINRSLSERQPQLIGFNSARSDLPIIVNRSVIHGLDSYGWAKRPDKPWEGMDYFSQHGDAHIDLGPLLGWGNQMPTLHEIATTCGIPGKIDASGASVADMWINGQIEGIVHYNEFDAFTTYLLWARVAHFSSLLDIQAYDAELGKVENLLESEIHKGKAHLQQYLDAWKKIRF